MPKGILWAIPIAPIAIPYDRHHPNGEPHHITLQYAVERSDWAAWLGVTFWAEITEIAWDKYSQAFRVQLPWDIPCQNSRPHITIGWADGRAPNDANRMLADLHFSHPLNPTHLIEFRIEFFEWANPPP
jgi:hypothetical protein